jgi:purine-binding chemotaxis protein CheW
MSDTTIIEADQYLTFTLGDEHYAIDVSKVKEVLEIQPITRIPKTPDYMRGVINVRGGVVPIIDLRKKFGMEEVEETVDTCIIVLEIELQRETVNLGAVADTVSEVIELPREKIEPPPKIGTKLDTAFIDGLGKYEEQFLIILNIDKVFSEEEILTAEETKRRGEAEEQ